MHGKGEFAKTKSSICNIPIEVANIYNILPRPADSNSLTVVKVKRYLKYRRYVYFAGTSKCYMPGTKLFKAHNTFYEDISISEGFSSKEMINYSGFDKHQDIAESIHKKLFQIKQNIVQLSIH